ncbi:MAG: RNA polymerase sigma factor [Flavobacteriaceae bacterium]|nr:RNA polymerase sigma factor [Flavobacteriaceae bacterium]MDH3795316.1 RNA polymerase sigma factor [Flavobacteriaceae bacterium]
MENTGKIFDGYLVLEYRSGNSKALSLLVSRYHLQFCKHAYWYTRNMDSAKDIAQDSWSTIITKISELRDPNKFKSWALRIVTRNSLDHLKRARKNKEAEASNSLPSPELERDDPKNKLKKLYGAISGLPLEQQVVLRLFYLENLSLKEVGEVLQISTGTVKSRLYYAREKLKLILIK